MNIAYVAFLPQGSPSVELRVVERAQAALQLAGKELQFIIIGQPKLVPAEPLPNLHYIEISRTYASRCRAQLLRYRIVGQALSEFDLDAIVIRYAGADLSAMRFFANRTVITEHHSNELGEGMATIPYKRGLRRQVKRLRLQLEKRYGSRLRNASKGIIGVTEELRALQVSRASRPPASTVISNGIDTGRFMQTRFVPFDGKTLKLAFVASVETAWSGLDRMLAGIRKYQGPVQIKLHIVGKADTRTVREVAATTSTVRFHGEKYGQDLDDLLGLMNLGVSSLALHRKNMRQACALKTREYTARGLPFVLAHEDPDLAKCGEDEEFFLKLPDDDSAIEIENLIQFAERMSSCPDVSNRMRRFAYERMDWKRKMSDLYDFVVAVTEESKANAGPRVFEGGTHRGTARADDVGPGNPPEGMQSVELSRGPGALSCTWRKSNSKRAKKYKNPKYR